MRPGVFHPDTPKPISTNWREKEENMLSNLDDISIIFSFPNWSISPLTILFSLVIMSRGGFGSGGSGFGEIRCPSVENKFTDNPSANRPLIGSGGRVG